MLDEAQRDDAPLSIMRDNLAMVWEASAGISVEEAQLIERVPHALRRVCDDLAPSLYGLVKTAIRLRARNLTPDAVTWESETRDGVPGWWMRVPKAT